MIIQAGYVSALNLGKTSLDRTWNYTDGNIGSVDFIQARPG